MPRLPQLCSRVLVISLATVTSVTCLDAAIHASGAGRKAKADAEVGERSEGPTKVAKIAAGLISVSISVSASEEETTAQMKAANAQAEAAQVQAAKAQMGAAQTQVRAQAQTRLNAASSAVTAGAKTMAPASTGQVSPPGPW